MRLLLLLCREKKEITKKKIDKGMTLQNKEGMDVETAAEIHREKVQNAIPDE